MGGSEGEARAEGDGVPVVLDLPNDELGAAAEGLFIYLCPRAWTSAARRPVMSS